MAEWNEEQVMAEASKMLLGRQFSNAKSKFGEVLSKDFSNPLARLGLRHCVAQVPHSDFTDIPSTLVQRLKHSQPFVNSAVQGWLFSLIVDSHFADDQLVPIRHSTSGNNSPSATFSSDDRSADDLLTEFDHQPSLTELYASLLKTTASTSAAVTADSFVASTPETQAEDVLSHFTSGRLNVVIIGAGPVGLALANSLRSALSTTVEIVVIDNRVLQPHQKAPYNREWLTYISTQSMAGLVDNRVLRTLERVAQPGHMGVTINIFETLLLLSCKSLGVRFLFDENCDLSFVKDSAVDLVFDATGGRLSPVSSDSDFHEAGLNLKVEGLGYFRRGYSKFGVPLEPDVQQLSISTRQVNGAHFVMHNDKLLKVAMVKMVNVPLGLLDPIMKWTLANNSDGRFYIWPGFLKDEVNRILIIINIFKKEYEALANVMPQAMSPAKVLAEEAAIAQIDPRITELFKFVSDNSTRDDQVRIEQPFIVQPYLRPYNEQNETLHGKPLIRVGDSVYNGNPKAGNGLASHLRHVAIIHDTLLSLLT